MTRLGAQPVECEWRPLEYLAITVNWLLPLGFLSLVSWDLMTKQVRGEDH